MEDKSCGQLTDYKFYYFNGKVRCLYVSTGLEDHKTARMGFLIWIFNHYPLNDWIFYCMIHNPKCLSILMRCSE